MQHALMLHYWQMGYIEILMCFKITHLFCMLLLQEGGPLPAPEAGLLSNTREWIVRGDTCWQSKRFYWERAPGWRVVGKGTHENCFAAWLAVLGFMVMGLVSGWSLANHSNSVFPGGAHIAQPRWMLARGILGSGRTRSVSFDLFRTLPVGGGLLVPYSLSGSPVVKQLMQMVTMVPGQGGWFQSVCFP